MAAIVSTNAILGTYKWALFGGRIAKITKYVGLLEKGHSTKKEIKIVLMIFRARKKVINALLKAPNKKKREGWGKYIKYITRYL